MTSEGRDPRTLIALIFRIVDEPRRTLAVAALAVLLIAAVSHARFPVAEVMRSALFGGVVCLAVHGRRQRVLGSRHGPCLFFADDAPGDDLDRPGSRDRA